MVEVRSVYSIKTSGKMFGQCSFTFTHTIDWSENNVANSVVTALHYKMVSCVFNSWLNFHIQHCVHVHYNRIYYVLTFLIFWSKKKKQTHLYLMRIQLPSITFHIFAIPQIPFQMFGMISMCVITKCIWVNEIKVEKNENKQMAAEAITTATSQRRQQEYGNKIYMSSIRPKHYFICYNANVFI